jgi:hypothetical protein
MCGVMNCHNVAKLTEFYLGELRFSVTYTGNAGCFETTFTMVFQHLEQSTVCTPFSVNVFVTLATQKHSE